MTPLEELDKLDRLAAEVMGWELIMFTDGRWTGKVIKNNPNGSDVFDWKPTRDIANAWQCLEKTIERNPIFSMEIREQWRCEFYDPEECKFYAEGFALMAPEAIVRACLKAKGVEI